MKTTVYFYATFPHHNLDGCMQSVITKRDIWQKENVAIIDEIDNENIKVTVNNNQVYIVLILSYYPKTTLNQ